MSTIKTDKNHTINTTNLVQEYVEIMKHVPIIVQMDHSLSNLKQPSLLEEVDSVTTYEVSATVQEWT